MRLKRVWGRHREPWHRRFPAATGLCLAPLPPGCEGGCRLSPLRSRETPRGCKKQRCPFTLYSPVPPSLSIYASFPIYIVRKPVKSRRASSTSKLGVTPLCTVGFVPKSIRLFWAIPWEL